MNTVLHLLVANNKKAITLGIRYRGAKPTLKSRKNTSFSISTNCVMRS